MMRRYGATPRQAKGQTVTLDLTLTSDLQLRYENSLSDE